MSNYILADMSRAETKISLEAVAGSERIPADINILPNNTVSIQPFDFPQYGRQEFRGETLRLAAWKASLFFSKLREQLDTEKELIEFAERYGIYERPYVHYSGVIMLAGQRYEGKNLQEAKQLAMATIKRLAEKKQRRRSAVNSEQVEYVRHSAGWFCESPAKFQGMDELQNAFDTESVPFCIEKVGECFGYEAGIMFENYVEYFQGIRPEKPLKDFSIHFDVEPRAKSDFLMEGAMKLAAVGSEQEITNNGEVHTLQMARATIDEAEQLNSFLQWLEEKIADDEHTEDHFALEVKSSFKKYRF